MGLEGKVALVTGAASGIGRAIALRLAEDGARATSAQIERKMPQIIVTGEQLIPDQTIQSDRGLL